MDGFSWIVNSDFSFKQFQNFVKEAYDKNRYVTFTWTFGRQRTKKQNSSLHVYLRHLSKAFNDAGLDMKKVLKPEIEIPWDDDGKMAKEHLWRPIQKILLDKESTVEPERLEYSQVYDVLNRHISQKFGISVPWPTNESDAETDV